jgi:hypothetical protein
MSAELEQRQRILSFCQHHDIPEPNFSSCLDLSRTVSAALNAMDGKGAGNSRVDRLVAQRDSLQTELNAYIVEVARFEQELHDASATIETIKALELIAQIEQIIEASLKQSQGQRLAGRSQGTKRQAP